MLEAPNVLLPRNLLNLLSNKNAVALVATVGQSGIPNVAPFRLVVASGPERLRLAVARCTLTFQNILFNNTIALAFVEEGNLAVSVKGLARVLREAMTCDPDLSIVEITAKEVKSFSWPDQVVCQGIRAQFKNPTALIAAQRIFAEIQEAEEDP
ncbi:MAG: pyridoxamine 5'-phosphate oxidase family protein [Syntrophothermus sp.]